MSILEVKYYLKLFLLDIILENLLVMITTLTILKFGPNVLYKSLKTTGKTIKTYCIDQVYKISFKNF